jgi:hypothetical protein
MYGAHAVHNFMTRHESLLVERAQPAPGKPLHHVQDKANEKEICSE